MNKLAYLWYLLLLSSLSPSIVFSAPLNLSNAPLYLGGNAEPNIMFILDDSGSMHYEVMPDEEFRFASLNVNTKFVYPRAAQVYGSNDYNSNIATILSSSVHGRRARSPQINSLYYNPSVTYTPWVKADGSLFPPANPSSAYHNPVRTTRGSRNLTIPNNRTDTGTGSSEFDSWRECTGPSSGQCSNQTLSTNTFWPATYYWFTGDKTSNRWAIANFDGPFEIRPTIDEYSGHGRINRNECNDGICTYAQEIQNFANWYTYYRSRVLTARAGIGRAFAKQSPGMRIGYATINNSSINIDGVSSGSVVTGVRPFSGIDRAGFFTNLYERTIPNSGTPLRQALYDVGNYFSSSDNRGPWGNTPGENDNTSHLQCRASYAIMMTDGYWSGTLSDTVGNTDNTAGLVISGLNYEDYQYSPVSPFNDSFSNTLADVAMHFWKRDLRTDLDNKVPTSNLDPSFWQNMVTFGVGLGVSGSIDPDTAFNAISTSSEIAWPEPTSSTEAKLDDLLHAAVNSRGGFFSASDPDTFSEQLSRILSNIADRTSSASSVALNSGAISSESLVYQARFNSGDWTGQLLGFPIINDTENDNFGELSTPPVWDARNLIPAANDRKIVTFDGNEGQPFRWANISAEQQALLISETILSYLRGNKSNELSNGGDLRNRNYLLGDIINSAPAYVAAPVQRYADNWGTDAPENASPYSTFRTTNTDRQPVVYVGANDGMLHAFNADNGQELFAYIPNILFSKLPDLANPNYTHKNYVDGSPTVVDAFINGEWKTVLVSGLGGGGQGVFALDVTDPGAFTTESTAASKVLWEFTDEDDADLGFTYGQPSIVRLQNGVWAAIFSGGYNNIVDNNLDGDDTNDSTTGRAFLYIVDLSDGSLIKKIDTVVGTVENPNGLASPAAIDSDGDFIVDFVYAGDLFGNMWKFDLSSTNTNNWAVAYSSGGNPQPLYKACFGATCDSSNIQPITTRPQVVRHPTSNGFLVLFGTGKYLEVNDNSISGQVTQSFYGVWDKNQSSLTAFSRSDLLQQSVTDEVTVDGTSYRVTSDNSINWTNDLGWYIDLISPNATENLGERQVSNAIIRNGRIIFTTLLPSDDPCDFGGSGWLMELNFATGARLSYSPFDITGEGVFSVDDYVCVANCDDDDPTNDVNVPTSGKQSGVGIIPTPSIATDTGGQREFKYTSGSSGNIEVTVENPGPGFEGRQSWRQLEFIFR
ncbi:pilus assembly protein [Methylophaga pinxianii]|uniref:pilus assembly protein n=1 Tax=Methylophaga pinxianii TaxID=2881052 RepID=UPI001CF18171|nr:PilC/PilY family type IV pilus protein [Methylophaga pinxianii]MCB2427774.1 pilus assembly protein PilY [Methylophaga pinxianii]UPH45621.1 pilus assembly protein PilY [Methylophaga pinxianii]